MNEAERTIAITCYYYKKSGKYYTDATGSYPASLFHDCIYPQSYGQRLRELRKLPGLHSGHWQYAFTVKIEGVYTELVLPEEL